jgi:hypothetical protein
MDELNKLKKIWDQSLEDRQIRPFDPQEIEGIIRKKSAGPVEKLKKSIRIEIGAIVLCIPLLIAIMFKLPETYFILNTSVLIIAFAASLVYFSASLRKVNRIWKNSQVNIRSSLESTLILFRYYRRAYIRLNLVLFPIGVFFGYVVGFGLGSDGQRIDHLLLQDFMPMLPAILLSLVLLAVLFIGFWFFLKFYVRKLYDVHINKLEIILRELLEND